MSILIRGMEMPKYGYRTVEIAFDPDGHPMAVADGGDVFDVIPIQHEEKVPVTNADRIRSMSDEELAEEIVQCREADLFRKIVLGTKMKTTKEWLDWLKQEVDE